MNPLRCDIGMTAKARLDWAGIVVPFRRGLAS